MIFDKNGKIYSKMEFVDEEEIENVVINNFKLLFGDYSILLDKNLIITNSGKGSIPDGLIIKKQQVLYKRLSLCIAPHLYTLISANRRLLLLLYK